MKIFKCKKGVSPLIATILLIAFAVALGAVVMQFGTSFDSDLCGAETQLSVQGYPCFDGTNVKMSLKNSGEQQISGVSIWIYGAKEGIKTKNLDSSVLPGSGLNGNIDYDKSIYGEISKIEIFPKIKIDNEITSCNSAKIEISEVSSC